jgi:ketosteroid isomerase-like protein
MKKMLVCLVIAMAAIAVQAQTGEKMSGDRMGSGVEQSIAKMELQWASASKMGNMDEIAPMLADKFVMLNSDGTMVDKATTLENMKKSKWEVNQLSDLKVTTFGDTAIATGGWRGKGTGADGKPVDAHERWVDTWVKMPGGKWQCIASAGTAEKM